LEGKVGIEGKLLELMVRGGGEKKRIRGDFLPKGEKTSYKILGGERELNPSLMNKERKTDDN